MPYEGGVWRPHDWQDWEIELIDGSLDTIGLLDEAVGARIVWGIYGYGDGSLALHIESERADDLLTAGQFYFRFLRDGVHIRDFLLAKDDRGYTVSNQQVDEYIEIALSPLDMILKDHPCLPENGIGQFTTPSSTLDNGFKWIVDHVCGPNAYSVPGGGSRSITGLTIAANTSAHATTDTITEAHKMDLFEFLQKYGVTWEIDWRVRLEKTTGVANQFVFETFVPARGLDKTEGNGSRMPVILNDASGEVRQARQWRPAVGFANVIIAKDLQSEVTDATSVSTHGRRELLADISDSDKMAALLAERGQRLGDEIDFNESEMVEIGTESWQIQPGDEITIGNQHLGITARDELVQSIELNLLSGGQERAALTFGRYEKSLGDKVSEGGSSGGGAYFDPIEGLQDDAGTFVPFSDGDDYIYVKLDTDAYLSATGNIGTNTIALALVDIPAHDLVSGYHTVSGLTPGHVLTALTANTFGFAAPSGGSLWSLDGTTLHPATDGYDVEVRDGAGATAIDLGADGKVDATGNIYTDGVFVARGGVIFLNSAGTTKVDGATITDNVLVYGAGNIRFYTSNTYRGIITTTAFRPASAGGLDLGTTTVPWGDVYAAKFYDGGNNSYYLDPASSGTALNILGNGITQGMFNAVLGFQHNGNATSGSVLMGNGSYIVLTAQSGIDHGSLGGLSDVADHAGYVTLDGARALTGDWSAGNYEIRTKRLYATNTSTWGAVVNGYGIYVYGIMQVNGNATFGSNIIVGGTVDGVDVANHTHDVTSGASGDFTVTGSVNYNSNWLRRCSDGALLYLKADGTLTYTASGNTAIGVGSQQHHHSPGTYATGAPV